MATATENHAMTNDPLLARQWLRTKHTSDLHWLIKGKDIWGKPINRSNVIKEEAERQLSLRLKGGALVRGTLKSMGHVYTGTGGWWISPLVTPEGNIAFIDTARGVAVSTDQVLDADTIEVLTVPDQGEGIKCSGAAVWTSPDAGEGHNAKTPPGWVQLFTDIRCDWPVEPKLIFEFVPGMTGRHRFVPVEGFHLGGLLGGRVCS